MIRARMLLIASIACAVAAGPAGAGIERAGTTAANFLALGSGPGVLAMGGAGLGLEGGLAAFDWNPATLAHIGRTEAVFSHASLGESNAQEWAGVGSRLRFGGLSGAVTGLFQHEGSFEGRDALNNPTGSFDVSSVAVGLGIARAIGPLVTAGLGIKYASENLGGVRGSGVAFDAGVQVRSAGFGFGAAAQNAFGKMKYDAASYDFPSSFGFGVSYEHAASGLRVALDMNFPAAYYNDIRGGLEWRWNERFALRTGYRAELGAASGEPLGGPTFGMGAGAGSMWFDYGYLVGGGVGQHRIGITFRPGSTALPPDGPEHRGRELEHASTNALPTTDKPQSAPAKPRANTPERAPTAASTAPPSGASASPATRAPASTPTSTVAPSSAPTPAGAPVKAPASTRTPAAGPLAAQAPPSYAQRAKAARGTGEASANDRASAALAPPASAPPRPPVAPQASSAPPAAAKRDSTAAPKSSPAPAASAPAPGTQASAAAARPDSAKAASSAPVQGPRPEKVRVRNGQTMGDIARAYGTSVPAIMMENNMVTDQVRPGQVLKLPHR
jgi:LysM repeat protein